MRTIVNFFEDSVDQFGDNPYLWEKRTGEWKAESYNEIRARVHSFAAGLLTAGIKKGDRLALLAEGRNDWVVSELGILYTGAVNVPLSILLTESELEFRIKHSGARILIVSERHREKGLRVLAKLDTLEKLLILDDLEGTGKDELLFSDLCSKGDEYLASKGEEFKTIYSSLDENDYANISYTSGTTAEPKGIVLSHLNYYANVQQAYTLLDLDPSWKLYLFIPWDHSFAHTAGLYSIMGKGASIASLQLGRTPIESTKNIGPNIKELKPQLIFSVPAISKNFRNNIESGIRAKGPFVEKMFKHALKLNYSYNKEGHNKGGGLSFLKLPLIKLYDAILMKKIREGLGGKMEYFVGGGALLDIELQRFFYAIGIPIYQGYGLSEASPVISANSPDIHKLGSSGLPVKNMEIKICDEDGNKVEQGQKGEILVKGENVMIKYWKNPQASEDTIKDGWLHTGDMGYIGPEGFLYVLGRFKSLLISGDGEKYSPEGIEEAMADQSEYILQCMVYNNQNPFTSILVVPDKEAIKRYLKSRELDTGTPEAKKAALELIQKEIYEYRKGGKHEDMFPQRWMPSTIAVLDQEFTKDNEFLNSMNKMVRGKITEYYQDTLKFLYTPEAKDINNKRNIEALEKLGIK